MSLHTYLLRQHIERFTTHHRCIVPHTQEQPFLPSTLQYLPMYMHDKALTLMDVHRYYTDVCISIIHATYV